MRLSDLLHSRVIDVDGVDLGRVKDVLVDRDAGFVVEGLVVGGYYATRLGFERGGAQGPWPISALMRRLERKARFVPWSAVGSCEHDVIRLTVPSEEFGSPPPV
jgi:sporulation protein YlmC with PRC-barrel domain